MKPGEPGRPRIVLLHFTAPPIVGGVEAVIAEHVRLFRDAGYETLIIAGRVAAEPEESLGKILVIPDMDSENPQYLEIYPELERQVTPPAFAEMTASIKHNMEAALRPDDIVIAHNVLTTAFNLALVTAIHSLVAQGKLRRLIVWCHDISRNVNPERDAPQYHGQPWDLLRTHIPGAVYVAVSTARRQSLANILGCSPDEIKVILNGVDAVQLLALSQTGLQLAETLGLFQADLVILMPVRITKVKNIEFALRVVSSLKQDGLDVRLIITGPPDPHAEEIRDYVDDLRDLRESLSLQADAIFLYDGTIGYPSPFLIDATVVAELYRIADLILMPSRREGFGMPVFEAAFLGRPVFATHVPATQELTGFQHLIQSGETPESVAERMRRWAELDAAQQLRKTVRREYTWRSIFSRKILPLIEQVADKTAGVRS
jgi:glycosyltransferase involved in cell wall biosynthesis